MVEKLTEKERRVVDLVARGRTNYEVADRLHLSHKTVEWTLTKVYKKLHVRSRTELTAKLAAAQVRGFPRRNRASVDGLTEDRKRELDEEVFPQPRAPRDGDRRRAQPRRARNVQS